MDDNQIPHPVMSIHIAPRYFVPSFSATAWRPCYLGRPSSARPGLEALARATLVVMSSAEPEPAVSEAEPGSVPPGWRFLLSPRWLGWHAAMVVSVTGMLALGYWQMRRAVEGNALSWAYTFEWPIFAVMAVVFWAKTIRDEFRPPATAQAASPGGLPVVGRPSARGEDDAGAGGAAATGGDDPEAEELAAYNAYLARLHEQVKGHGRWHGLR